MNRKWLAAFTCCILGVGLTLALQTNSRAQSQASSESQTQTPGVAIATEATFVGAEPFDVFTSPVDAASMGGEFPFPDPAAGDVFFYKADGPIDMAFAGPAEFTAAIPFPGPDPQGGVGVTAGNVNFVGPDPKDTITFVGFEAGLGNQAVSGAPYSAQITSEFVQTLPDGNKIERKTTTTVYRDGQGRTRREQSLPAIGKYAASDSAPQAIFINDPIAGVSYVLNPAKKTARKMPRPQFSQGVAGGPGGGPGGPGRGPVTVGPGPGGPGRGPAGPPPQGNANGPGPGRGQRGPDPNVSNESLGTQNIEGILVQGTRVVRTIPAGTVGNQNPIRVVNERWYSPDLKLNLSVKNTDPMRGENSTTLSNIRRDEPAASLFEVPADYTVQEPPKRMILRGQRGGPPPPQQ